MAGGHHLPMIVIMSWGRFLPLFWLSTCEFCHMGPGGVAGARGARAQALLAACRQLAKTRRRDLSSWATHQTLCGQDTQATLAHKLTSARARREGCGTRLYPPTRLYRILVAYPVGSIATKARCGSDTWLEADAARARPSCRAGGRRAGGRAD